MTRLANGGSPIDSPILHPQLTWDESWARPGESVRNIIYRLAKANCCSTRALLAMFLRDQQNDAGKRRDNTVIDLLVPTAIDLQRLAATMRVAELTLWSGSLLPLLDAWFPPIYVRSHYGIKAQFFKGLLSRNLRYCPRCMEEGYHTALWQLLPVSCCLKHDRPMRLLETCPHCQKKIGAFRHWKYAEKTVNPAAHCPECATPLSQGEHFEASGEEIQSTRHMLDFWNETADPGFVLLPMSEVARRLDFAWENAEIRHGSGWRPPVTRNRIRPLFCPPAGDEPFINLANLLHLMRALDLTPATLAATDVPPGFKPRRLWGPIEWRSDLISAIKAGENKRCLQRRLRIGHIKFDDCLHFYLAEGTLIYEEAAPYLHQPRCADERTDTVQRLARKGMTVYSIQKRVGLEWSVVKDLVRRDAVSRSQQGTRLYSTGCTGMRRWTPHIKARRATLLQAISRIEANGRPITLSDIAREFGTAIYQSFQLCRGPFGGPDGDEFRAAIRRRIVATWVRTYPDVSELSQALTPGGYRLIRLWAKEFGYLTD